MFYHLRFYIAQILLFRHQPPAELQPEPLRVFTVPQPSDLEPTKIRETDPWPVQPPSPHSEAG